MTKIIIALIIISSFLPSFVLAGESEALGLLEGAGREGGYVVEGVTETTVSERIGQVLMVFLSLLGTIFLILMITGGFKWMTAKGNEEQITEAQGTLRAGIIGLIIVIAAYSLGNFIGSLLF